MSFGDRYALCVMGEATPHPHRFRTQRAAEQIAEQLNQVRHYMPVGRTPRMVFHVHRVSELQDNLFCPADCPDRPTKRVRATDPAIDELIQEILAAAEEAV